MIRYSLTCEKSHSFDSWFQSAEAFDNLKSAGMVTCPDCGSSEVQKALMAPQVRVSDKAAPPPAEEKRGALSPATEREKALAELRRKVEENSDYVGMSFAAEARKMHDGDAPARSIWGEAKPAEAKALIEDGIPVAPLPFMPSRKTN